MPLDNYFPRILIKSPETVAQRYSVKKLFYRKTTVSEFFY